MVQCWCSSASYVSLIGCNRTTLRLFFVSMTKRKEGENCKGAVDQNTKPFGNIRKHWRGNRIESKHYEICTWDDGAFWMNGNRSSGWSYVAGGLSGGVNPFETSWSNWNVIDDFQCFDLDRAAAMEDERCFSVVAKGKGGLKLERNSKCDWRDPVVFPLRWDWLKPNESMNQRKIWPHGNYGDLSDVSCLLKINGRILGRPSSYSELNSQRQLPYYFTIFSLHSLDVPCGDSFTRKTDWATDGDNISIHGDKRQKRSKGEN